MPEFNDNATMLPPNSLFTSITNDSIQSLNPKTPLTVAPDMMLVDAVQLMQEKRIGAVLVEEGGKLVGILTERDMLFKVLGKDIDIKTTQVQEIMTTHPESLTADDQIIYALNRMTIGGYRHIPLTDLNEQLTGIISVKDIVEYLVGLVEREVFQSGL
jgi:CBS domain-containing protein